MLTRKAYFSPSSFPKSSPQVALLVWSSTSRTQRASQVPLILLGPQMFEDTATFHHYKKTLYSLCPFILHTAWLQDPCWPDHSPSTGFFAPTRDSLCLRVAAASWLSPHFWHWVQVQRVAGSQKCLLLTCVWAECPWGCLSLGLSL